MKLCKYLEYRVNHVSKIYPKKLACPARFERATYALEEFVAVKKSMYFNDLYA